MHARLLGRWAPPKVPIVRGGWYPVIEEGKYDLTIRVEDRPVCLGRGELDVTEAPRRRAVWGFPPEGGPAVVVCPAGHRISEVGPVAARARCGPCGKDYEIEA